MATDILGRKLAVGDFVMHFHGLYQVLELKRNQQVKICLVIQSKSTRPVVKLASELCRVPAEDVVIWMLKRKS